MNVKTKSLIANILPALGGLFVTYLYNVVDGVFAGQGVGSAALGAVNIAVPFITFVVALTAMFPMGGATVVAIRMGRRDKDGANHAFMTAFSVTLLVSVILMTVGMVFSQQIVDLSGAKNLSVHMRKMSAQYLFYCSAFSIPMLMGSCLSVFVRNDGSPTLSFVGMCTGAVANIFLDWLFIFPFQMGIIGAAIASGLGTEKPGVLMRKYAIPCIISLLVGALYNIVDQIFIANAAYLGSYGNAANTVVFPLTVIPILP